MVRLAGGTPPPTPPGEVTILLTRPEVHGLVTPAGAQAGRCGAGAGAAARFPRADERRTLTSPEAAWHDTHPDFGYRFQPQPARSSQNLDNPGATSYPITSATFIDVNKDLCKAGLSASAAQGVVKLIDYGLDAGQAVLSAAQYAALPAAILAKDKAAAAGLQCNGAPIAP